MVERKKRVRRVRRRKRRSKRNRLILLSVGGTALVLGVALFVGAFLLGNPKFRVLALAYWIFGLGVLMIHSLNNLQYRQMTKRTESRGRSS